MIQQARSALNNKLIQEKIKMLTEMLQLNNSHMPKIKVIVKGKATRVSCRGRMVETNPIKIIAIIR